MAMSEIPAVLLAKFGVHQTTTTPVPVGLMFDDCTTFETMPFYKPKTVLPETIPTEPFVVDMSNFGRYMPQSRAYLPHTTLHWPVLMSVFPEHAVALDFGRFTWTNPEESMPMYVKYLGAKTSRIWHVTAEQMSGLFGTREGDADLVLAGAVAKQHFCVPPFQMVDLKEMLEHILPVAREWQSRYGKYGHKLTLIMRYTNPVFMKKVLETYPDLDFWTPTAAAL
jgi:hypothetical protein